MKTSKLPGARENASGEVAIGFSFESDRLYGITECILHSDWNYFRHLIELIVLTNNCFTHPLQHNSL